ncbi:flagellar hook-basal body complex protein [Pusillimonas sp. SM2304]|uniref:flagellar hook protein FlgE n=1 Tax=Pusillimonas sp. SM2304 TaxID=3073241 RepID=UPI002875EDBC|nr:flagellar hook-basal body complex protein [Pusillimonas sp. SM2304]MDS1141118.1 flagellar hook-basal body complex protein [Pusillimonas sp. SM2304]
MGFGQGLSGLNAAAQNLDVIGNNIANSGTVGFKAGSATFADVYASSRVGLGVQVASINQRFTIGNVSGTGNQFDMAIDGAKGLFRVLDQSGSVLYTRNGQFFPNKDGYLVNAQGHRLTGYEDGGTNIVPIRVPSGNIAPAATSTVTTKANLNANAPLAGGQVLEEEGVVVLGGTTYTFTGNWSAPVWTGATPPDGNYTTGADNVPVTIAAGVPDTATLPEGGGNSDYIAPVAAAPFDPADPTSYSPSHSLPINIYDSLGNSHQLIQYFAKRESTTPGVSEWDVYYRLDGAELPAPYNDASAGTRRMTFDDGGRLTNPTAPIAINIPGIGGVNSPAQTLSFTLDYANSTQFGGDFNSTFGQNGYATGEYASMSVAADGSIVASYTNGETRANGTLVLADFANLQGLQPVGGNAWAETSASGQPILGRPGSNGMAQIKGQAVEDSNVDMSQELVNMIIAQRTYQANAQTIKTQDQVLQTLINMR